MNKYLSIFLQVIFISISQAQKDSDTLHYVFESIDVYSTSQKHSSPLSLHIIKSDDLAVDKNKQTINKSLYFVPGLTVMNNNNFAQDARISIRGVGIRSSFGVRGIKILVDGVPESTPDGQAQLDNLDLSFIRSINIFQGANSPLFGNASGGAINFITSKNNKSDAFEINSSYSASRTTKHTLFTSKSYKNLSYQLNFLSKDHTGYRNHSEMKSHNLNAIFSLNSKKGELFQLLFNYINSPISNDAGSLTIDEVNEDRTIAREKNILYKAGEDVVQQKTTLKYKKIINPGFLIDNYIFYLNRRFNNKLPFEVSGQVQFDRNYFGVGGSILKQKKYNNLDYKISLNYQVLAQQDLRKKYNNLEGLRGDITYDSKESFNSYSLSSHNSMLFMQRLNLTSGIRLDRNVINLQNNLNNSSGIDYNVVYDNISPFLGIAYDYSKYLNFHLAFSRNFETPTLYEIGNNPYDNNENFNSNLKPVISPSAEIGWKIKNKDFYNLNLTFYHSASTNELIPFEIESEPGRTYYRNAGSTRKSGLEFYSMINIQGVYKLKAAYTLADHIYKTYHLKEINLDKKKIPLSPKHQSAFELQLSSFFNSNLVFRLISVGDFFADDLNNTIIKGYTILDFGVSKKLKLFQNNFELQLYFENVLNELYFSNIRMNAYGGRFYEPSDESSVLISLSYLYK